MSVGVEYKDMIKFSKEVLEKYNIFKDIKLIPIKTYEGLDTAPAWDFKVPMASGFYRGYRVEGDDKIDKICIGELYYMQRAIYSLLTIVPTDNYDLPMYMCKFDESVLWLSITTDFCPLVDITVYDEYRIKYLSPLTSIWEKYKDLPGFTDGGRCFLQRRFSGSWARATLSHCALDGKIRPAEARKQALEASMEYAKIWLKLWKEAETVKNPEYEEKMLQRKKTMRQLYRDKDPVGEVIKKLFGEDRFKLFVTLIF